MTPSHDDGWGGHLDAPLPPPHLRPSARIGRHRGDEATKPAPATRPGIGDANAVHPLDRIRRRPIPGYIPFPADALPHALASYIRSEARRKDIDPAMIAAPALAMLAGVVGNAVRVVVKQGWVEPCCLWLGVIALPGTGKSPAQDAALAPVFAAQRRADQEHRVAMAKHVEAVEAWESERKAKRAEKPAVGETRPPATPKPESPMRAQLVVSDVTPEAMVQVLSGNPRGVVAVYDELAAMFGNLARYGGKGKNAGEASAGLWKSVWSGRPHFENRKGIDGRGTYIHLPSPLASVVGGIQPEAFNRVVNAAHIEDGLASRFLWVRPPDRAGRWVDDDDGDDAAAERYAAVFARLSEIPSRVGPDGAIEPVFLGIARPAQAKARAWVDRLAERVEGESDPGIRAAMAKLKGYLFRLALLLHLAEWAERPEATEPGAIQPERIDRAIALADWFGGEAVRVYSLRFESEADAELRRVCEYIAGKGGRLTPSELARGLKARYKGDAEAAEMDCQTLVDRGRAAWEDAPPGPSGGRGTRRVVLADTETGTPFNAGDSVGFCSSDNRTGDAIDGWEGGQ